MKKLTLILAALADENRLRLLHLMRDGEICVCFLQGALKTNQPKISRHLAYLRKAGLVQGRRQGKWMYYKLCEQTPKQKQLLKAAFSLIEEEAQIKRDRERVKQIECCPARFGLSDPGV